MSPHDPLDYDQFLFLLMERKQEGDKRKKKPIVTNKRVRGKKSFFFLGECIRGSWLM
jgi:hypothetical protein